MSDSNARILNEIDAAKDFAVESGVIDSVDDSNYLKLVQSQILRLFWKQSTRLISSDVDLELQHLILQDVVQMAKVLKDWSLGDKTLEIKNKKDSKEYSPAELMDLILEQASKKNNTIELPLDKLAEIEHRKEKEEKDKMEAMGINKN
ncbi:MAG: hypothetical protein WC917_03650 [Bacilli bacterium]|jgi:hypothetical protein